MLELITSYSLSQVPYIHDSALEEYAEKIVLDFSPDILLAPQPFDAEGFVEYYLGLEVEYRRIRYDRRVLGMTAFNTGFIQVINEETGLTEPFDVTAGTIVVDPILTQKRNQPRMRFTITHEGCHWLMHRLAFAEDNPLNRVNIYENQYLAAKAGRIDYSRNQEERTDIQRIERQADFLASAILMPKDPLRMAYCDFFKFYGEKPWHRIVRGSSDIANAYAKMLPKYIAKQFNVSKRAATIRLEKLTAIVDKPCMGFRV